MHILVDNQSYLRKCGVDDCMSTLLELNVQNPAVCLACLKVIFSQTLNGILNLFTFNSVLFAFFPPQTSPKSYTTTKAF